MMKLIKLILYNKNIKIKLMIHLYNDIPTDIKMKIEIHVIQEFEALNSYVELDICGPLTQPYTRCETLGDSYVLEFRHFLSKLLIIPTQLIVKLK